jgi:hypothetical protein
MLPINLWRARQEGRAAAAGFLNMAANIASAKKIGLFCCCDYIRATSPAAAAVVVIYATYWEFVVKNTIFPNAKKGAVHPPDRASGNQNRDKSTILPIISCQIRIDD